MIDEERRKIREEHDKVMADLLVEKKKRYGEDLHKALMNKIKEQSGKIGIVDCLVEFKELGEKLEKNNDKEISAMGKRMKELHKAGIESYKELDLMVFVFYSALHDWTKSYRH